MKNFGRPEAHHVRSFFLVAFAFFLARGRHAPWRGGICFFCASPVCFSGPVFFRREGGTISWAGPGWEDGQDKKKLPAQMEALQIIKKCIKVIA